MTETNSTDTNQQRERLLEQILSRDNVNRAYKQVKRNKGAGGIEGMQVDSERNGAWQRKKGSTCLLPP